VPALGRAGQYLPDTGRGVIKRERWGPCKDLRVSSRVVSLEGPVACAFDDDEQEGILGRAAEVGLVWAVDAVRVVCVVLARALVIWCDASARVWVCRKTLC
jgi:hypothetical protein